MAAKKSKNTSSKQQNVRIDATQMLYLQYISELTGISIAAVVREAIEDHLDMAYARYVTAAEEKAHLPSSTCRSNASTKDENKAFEQMLENLKDVKEAKQYLIDKAFAFKVKAAKA